MKVLVQIVEKANLKVNDTLVSQIGYGFVLYVGFKNNDSYAEIKKMALKISKLRIFPDENEKTNLNIFDVQGEVLSVSQFTLYADTEGANRPSFSDCLKGAQAKELYLLFNLELRNLGLDVKEGIFGETMIIEQSNYGPFSVVLEN